jgi:phosphate transport system substrate-binding protein
MLKTKFLSGFLSAIVISSSASAQITAVGSSTVYPFITVVAENFGNDTQYKSPIIESTGTGGGMKLFCQGLGAKTPDFTNASREIKQSEIDLCNKNGVIDILEIKVGYDGIIIANSNEAKKYNLTRNQVFLALAREVPLNGKLVENPYKKWSDIDKSLPAKEIAFYGPPPTSGTRDAFVELVMQKSCVGLSEFKAVYENKKLRKKKCSQIREDGVFMEAGENDNLIIQKLSANKDALGIFGYSYLEQNLDKVQGSTINNITPTFDNISTGNYPVSRSLYVYVKEQHYDMKPELKTFVQTLVSEDTIGEDGYLVYKGLIPITFEELNATQELAYKNM